MGGGHDLVVMVGIVSELGEVIVLPICCLRFADQSWREVRGVIKGTDWACRIPLDLSAGEKELLREVLDWITGLPSISGSQELKSAEDLFLKSSNLVGVGRRGDLVISATIAAGCLMMQTMPGIAVLAQRVQERVALMRGADLSVGGEPPAASTAPPKEACPPTQLPAAGAVLDTLRAGVCHTRTPLLVAPRGKPPGRNSVER